MCVLISHILNITNKITEGTTFENFFYVLFLEKLEAVESYKNLEYGRTKQRVCIFVIYTHECVFVLCGVFYEYELLTLNIICISQILACTTLVFDCLPTLCYVAWYTEPISTAKE